MPHRRVAVVPRNKEEKKNPRGKRRVLA
ncbi:hypothetical protein EE612_046654 [Oryza sativa]|nr:hypothetical protein EE612_046654 [Oryza sativa]